MRTNKEQIEPPCQALLEIGIDHQMEAWSANTDRDKCSEIAALARIVSTLLALSALAERLFGAPAPLRLLVVWILRRAEAAAREYVIVNAEYPMPLWDGALADADGDTRLEAIRLANSFRSLALLLGASPDLLRRSWTFGCDCEESVSKSFERVYAPSAALRLLMLASNISARWRETAQISLNARLEAVSGRWNSS